MTGPSFPEGEDLRRHIGRRRRRGGYLRVAFLAALMVAIVALGTLLYTVINSSFGLVAIENEIDPASLVVASGYDADRSMEDLTKGELVAVLEANISNNVGRRLEREQRFFPDRLVFETEAKWDEVCARSEDRPTGCSGSSRDADNVYALIVEQLVVPQVRQSWSLLDSIFERDAIEEIAAAQYPEADVLFRSWLSWDFVSSPQSPEAEVSGVRTAILGSLWIVFVTIVFSLPVGVGAAVYLEEYAGDTRLNRLIQTNINNLAGVPSIIYGMLGLAIFVRFLEAFTSGAFLRANAGVTANGRTILSAGLTLGLLILPIIIINAQEAVRAVPSSLRAAGLALGATRWQTIQAHVLPSALPGILTGAILALARALGETAPLVVVGASTFITADPTGPFSKFTALPIQIFQWTSRPQDEFRNIAAAAIVVLLILLVALNATAIVLRNRYARRA